MIRIYIGEDFHIFSYIVKEGFDSSTASGLNSSNALIMSHMKNISRRMPTNFGGMNAVRAQTNLQHTHHEKYFQN